jgi:hypothetical protein
MPIRILSQFALVIAAALTVATVGFPEDLASDAERLASEKRLADMESLAKACVLSRSADTSKSYVLELKPLLRWSNPISGIVDGSLWLWTDSGRPIATVDIFAGKNWNGWNHQYQSLSAEPFECRQQNLVRWNPKEPGRTLKPVPDAPVPAKTPEQRLIQMRALARQFTVEDDFKTKFRGPEFKTHELRLLAQPLYRYGGDDQPVQDGALFGFVLATACEALLTLEVHNVDGQPAWHYSLAGQTCYELRAKHGDKIVWEQPCWDTAFDPAKPFFAFSAGLNN